MKNQTEIIASTTLFPVPTRIKLLLELAKLQQKEIAISHNKSCAIINMAINHNYNSEPAKLAVYNMLKAKLPGLIEAYPDHKSLWQ